MRKFLMTALAAAAALSATPALATNHGFCTLSGGTSMCLDNGTNTPTTTNPPVFGFSTSPGPVTDDLLIAILIPNNDTALSSYSFSGYLNGTATSAGTWTSGNLQALLPSPFSGSTPANPIGAFLPATQALDAGATGFYVFTVDLGTQTLPANNAISDSYLSTLGQGVPIGSYIVAYLGTSATANSGAILVDGPPLPEPATWAMMLLGFGGIGMAMRRTRRRNAALMQIA